MFLSYRLTVVDLRKLKQNRQGLPARASGGRHLGLLARCSHVGRRGLLKACPEVPTTQRL